MVLPPLAGGESPPDEARKLEEFLRPFVITDELLTKFLKVFAEDLKKGLKKSTNAIADMKCFPTYVSKLPTGTERGRYLVIDENISSQQSLIIRQYVTAYRQVLLW